MNCVQIKIDQEFLDAFGDYTKIPKKQLVLHPEYRDRVNENGEPMLFYNNDLHKHYYLDKENEPVFYPYDEEGIRQFLNTNEVKTFAKMLASNFYFNNIQFDYENLNFARKDNKSLKESISNFLERKIGELAAEGDDIKLAMSIALEQTTPHLNEWVKEVKDFFNSFKVNYQEDEMEEMSEEESSTKGDSFRKEAFTVNQKNNVSNNIKLFLSLLRKNTDNYFNEKDFVNYNDVYTTLNTTLSNEVALDNEDLYDIYTEKIAKIAGNKRKPYLAELHQKLTETAVTEVFKNQFVNAFNLHKNNFLGSESVRNKQGEVNYKVMNLSDVTSRKSAIINQWEFNFNGKQLNSNRLAKQDKDVRAHLALLNREVKNITNEGDLIPHLNNLKKDLNELGVEFTQKGLDYFLDNQQLDEVPLTEKIYNLQKAFESLSYGLRGYSVDNPNIFTDQSLFTKLAASEAFFMEEGSDASVFALGKTKWVYSLPSYLSLKIEKWKKDPNLLYRHLLKTDYNRGSAYMSYLAAAEIKDTATRVTESKRRLDDVELAVFNSVQRGGDSSNATDNKSINYTDSLLDYLHKILMGRKNDKSYHKTALAADKSTEYQIHFGKNSIFNIYANARLENGEVKVNRDVSEIFYTYFKSEYNRMRTEYKNIQLGKDLKTNYHTGPKNALQSQLFPSLSIKIDSKTGEVSLPFLKDSKGEALTLYDNTGKPIYKELDQVKEDIIPYINKALSKGIQKTYNNLIDNNIVGLDLKGNRENRLIDRNIFNFYESRVGKESAPLQIAADMFINSVMSQVEFAKMFTGDVAYYKNPVDYKKRVPATYSDGQYLRISNRNDKHFTVAVVKAVEVSPQDFDKMAEYLDKDILDKYVSVNNTDAQAWITPERWKFIMDKLGKFDKVAKDAYNEMTKVNGVLTKEQMKLVAQPLKGVYFDMTDKAEPVYLKYSQAVLLPNVIKGTGLEKLYNQMVKDGVDEAVTEDGIKVGSSIPVETHNPDGSVKNNFTFDNKITLNNASWKLQQDLPTKGFKETVIGSQIKMNIFQGLAFNLGEDFELGDRTLSGSEMIDHINSLYEALSDKGVEAVVTRLGLDPNNLKVKDEKIMYKSLIKQLKQRNDVPDNFIKALEAGLSPYGIPGAFRMFQNVMSSLLNDETINIKTNGGGFIQMSDYGLSKAEATQKGIRFTPWFDENKLGTYRKQEGKKSLRPAQIFISGSLISPYIPNWKSLKDEELFSRIDPEILQKIVGYRIPNQGLPSNDALQIAGIMPEGIGDTVVAYTGITTKTGSDFDIDKMYLMVPSFYSVNQNESADEENVYKLIYAKPKYKNGELLPVHQQNQKALRNMLIESYQSVLTNPAVINSVMNPIDLDYIKNDIKNLFPETSASDLETFDAIFDLETKDQFRLGKAGLGQNINSLIDSVRGSMGGLSLPHYLGWGTQENGVTVFDKEFSETLTPTEIKNYVESYNETAEKKITVKEVQDKLATVKLNDSMMMLVNAFADIAKDPYIVQGNWVTQTNNLGFMLLRAGVHPFRVNAFLAQPVLREFIRYRSNQESKSINISGNIFERFKITKASELIPSENVTINNITYNKRQIFNEVANPQRIAEIGGYDIDDEGNYTDAYKMNKEDFFKDFTRKLMKTFNTNALDVTKDPQLLDELTALKEEFIKAYEDVFEVEPKEFSDITLKDLRDQIKGKTDIATQISVLHTFDEWLQDARDVNDNNIASGVAVNGKGKDLTSLVLAVNRIDELLNPSDKRKGLKGFRSKLRRSEDGQGTLLQTSIKNGLGFAYEFMKANPKYFFGVSKTAISTFNVISDHAMRGRLKSQKLADKIERSFYNYVMSGFKPLQMSASEKVSLITTMPDKLKEVAKDLPDNLLIKELINKASTKKDMSFISMPNVNKSVSYQNEITDSWRDLFKTHPEFAEDLVKYSFLASGFNNSIGQFHHYIPYEWFNRNRFNSYLKSLSRDYTDTVDYAFIDQFFRNHIIESPDTLLSRRVYPDGMKFYGGNNKNTSFYLTDSDVTKRTPPYILYTENEENGTRKYYKYIGGNQYDSAIYLRTTPLGFKDERGNSMTEYNFGISKQFKTVFSDNKVNPSAIDTQQYGRVLNDGTIKYHIDKHMIARDINNSAKVNIAIQVSDNTETPVDNHKMYYKMPSADNIWKENTTTLKEVESGRRTATTRSFPLGQVGDIITFENKPQKYIITQVEQLTKENTTNPDWIKQWSNKEGWTVEYFNQALNKTNTVKLGSYQTTFEKISDTGVIETEFGAQLKEALSNQVPVSDNNIAFEEEPTSGYRNRTIKNASADATIAMAVDFNSAGEKLTKNSVLQQGKRYIPVDLNQSDTVDVDRIVNQLNALNKPNISLNIAGNGIYTFKGSWTQEQVDDYVYELLKDVINSPNLTTQITSIRTGGQTGVDEAGAKAGIKLGIPTSILAPKGWKFRNIEGKDISSEAEFKSRFEEQTNTGKEPFDFKC